MKVKNHKVAVKLTKELIRDWNKEHAIGIYLDTHLNLIKAEILSIGILNATMIHARELYRPAIISNAAAVVLLHNHPSGELKPSKLDIQAAKQMKKAGEILGIYFQDSIIFNISGKYYSLGINKKI